jgi:hypothetical protein
MKFWHKDDEKGKKRKRKDNEMLYYELKKLNKMYKTNRGQKYVCNFSTEYSI